jgi:hypothetical protein
MLKSSSEEWKEQKGKIGPPTNSQRQTKMETSAKLGARSIAPHEKLFRQAKPCSTHREFQLRRSSRLSPYPTLLQKPAKNLQNCPQSSQVKPSQLGGIHRTRNPKLETRNGHSPLFQPLRPDLPARQPETPNPKPETTARHNHLPNASAPLDLAALDLKLCI